MSTRILEPTELLKSETIDSLQEMVRALNDSAEYHAEAADKIKDDGLVASTLRGIASERRQICRKVAELITMADEKPDKDGTWMGKLRNIWTAFRAGLNAGDATVVLIEAERAEDAIVHKFEQILPETADTPIFGKLKEHYETVKRGHDRVLALRNSYQDKI